MMKSPPPLLSIIIPIYNEEQGIRKMFTQLDSALSFLKGDYEIIYVDDGSCDNSVSLLEEIRSENNRVKILSFSRNFGKEAALTAGLNYAEGQAVIPIDADLQEPPEVIEEMVRLWREEKYDVVYGIRETRKYDSFMKRLTSALFYKVFNAFSKDKIPEDAGDFRLMDRKVVEAVKLLNETNRFMKGLLSWPGFNSKPLYFKRGPRAFGKTKWNYRKLFNFALDGIFSFNTALLRIFLFLGISICVLSLAYGTIIVLRTLLYGVDIPGYASLFAAIAFLGGLNLLGLGIMGEYIGRIFIEVKRRPHYIIDSFLGFEESQTKKPD